MLNTKEDIDVYKMYGNESLISKEEFIEKKSINI